MRFCRPFCVVVALGVVAATTSPARAGPAFNFESTPVGFYSPSLSVTVSGLTLTVTPEGFPNGSLSVQGSGVPLLGSRSIIASQLNGQLQVNQFAPMRFSFSSAVDEITFQYGDAGGDDDTPVVIRGYDSSNNLLGTLNDTYPGGFAAGKEITGNFGNASYFILESGTLGNNKDSIFFEVKNVELAENAVPVPASVLLFGLGTISTFGLSRWTRRQRAAA